MCVIYDGRPRAQPRQQLLYHARKGARGAQESITGELFIHILFSCCFFVFQAGEVSPCSFSPSIDNGPWRPTTTRNLSRIKSIDKSNVNRLNWLVFFETVGYRRWFITFYRWQSDDCFFLPSIFIASKLDFRLNIFASRLARSQRVRS